MLRLNQTQRTLLAEKLGDAGNLAAGALIFGQLLAEHFSALIASCGGILWFVTVGCALRLVRKGKP
jgi:hypothetical protein